MKVVGICANMSKPLAAQTIQHIQTSADRLDLELVADVATADSSDSLPGLKPEEMIGRVDALLALGGDGTLMAAVHGLAGAAVPVLGVNLGGLGFLTSVAVDELDRALECVASDDVEIIQQPLLKACILDKNGSTRTVHALNEVVVARGTTSRVVQLDVSVDGDWLTTYSCDGIIVSTPLGSTGYSLSAGGPILTPTTSAFVITMICPHALGSRPVVIPNHCTVRIATGGDDRELLLSADGQVVQALRPDDAVDVTRSDRSVHLIQLPAHSYFTVLRQKLNWRGTNIK